MSTAIWTVCRADSRGTHIMDVEEGKAEHCKQEDQKYQYISKHEQHEETEPGTELKDGCEQSQVKILNWKKHARSTEQSWALWMAWEQRRVKQQSPFLEGIASKNRRPRGNVGKGDADPRVEKKEPGRRGSKLMQELNKKSEWMKTKNRGTLPYRPAEAAAFEAAITHRSQVEEQGKEPTLASLPTAMYIELGGPVNCRPTSRLFFFFPLSLFRPTYILLKKSIRLYSAINYTFWSLSCHVLS